MMNDIPHPDETVARPVRKTRLAGIALLSLFFVAVFVGLGVWQLERLSWKLDLIARVNARVDAPALPIPAEKDWAAINAADDEYRHVTATGHFLNGKESLVYASTERGPGYWVLTPLQRDDGSIVYVNRGYVPTARKDKATREDGEIGGETRVTGLLRINEPGGTLLRSNDPADGRWYSRDVLAMGAKADLDRIAPFFIDADATPNPGDLPVGGLTIVKFPNSHLSYALTWFAMAALSIVGGVILWRAELKRGS